MMGSKHYGCKGGGGVELLEKLHRQGFELILGEGDRIGIRPADKLTPDLAEQIRRHKPKLIEELRKQTKPDEYQDKGQGKENDSEASEKAKRRYCVGYKPARYVHPDVCQWHISEADLACVDCQHLTRKEKETFMDSYLNKAIGRLNAEGAVYYTPSDSQARRDEIHKLEKEITATFLACNVSAFVEAVDNWRKCFNAELRNN